VKACSTRWVCAGCWRKGRGAFPDECPRCAGDDIRWLIEHAADPRPMAHVVLEAMDAPSEARH
jgi:hypothetical protein